VATSRLKDHWREQRLFASRALIAAFTIIALTGIVVVRLVDLQVINHEHFSQLSHGNRVRLEPLPPTRGLVYDREGRVLARNRPAYQLELVPEQVPDLENTLLELVYLGLVDSEELEEIRRKINAQRRFDAVTLRYDLDAEEAARFSVRRQTLPGVDIRARLARDYPEGDVAVHALGYVGSISEDDLKRLDGPNYMGTSQAGKLGIERSYEDLLHGTTGHRQLLVNAQGRMLEELQRTDASPGSDIYLTLDLDVQRAAEAALGDYRGAIVAIDPRNGHVIALASTPTYDPNLFSRGISRAAYKDLQTDLDKPLFNRALRGSYPPGSTIKPLMGLAGLHYNATQPWRSTFCRGWFSLPGSSHRFRDWKKVGHGPVSLISATAQSCDIYFYELAVELGIDRMHEFLLGFGLGSPTDVDIPGEKSGLLPSREWKRQAFNRRQDQVWFPGETVIAGIGQGYMLTTPMQLAQSMAILANRGHGFRPTLLAAIADRETGEPRAVPPVPLEPVEVAAPEFWDITLQSMVEVVHGRRGTARAIGKDAPYIIAGKTGTAQVFTVAQDAEYDEEEVEERLRHHALFVAIAPAEDPRIALAVIVENGGSGSGTAAPVARTVMDAWLEKKTE
jgi:penicillin-binding protein 2